MGLPSFIALWSIVICDLIRFKLTVQCWRAAKQWPPPGNRSTTRRSFVVLERVIREIRWSCCLGLNQILSMLSTRRTKRGNLTRCAMFYLFFVDSAGNYCYCFWRFRCPSFACYVWFSAAIIYVAYFDHYYCFCFSCFIAIIIVFVTIILDSLVTVSVNQWCLMCHRIRWVHHRQLKLNLKSTVRTSMVSSWIKLTQLIL